MREIHGNTTGIRDSFLEQLKELYEFPVGSDEFLPPELAGLLAAATARINREISVYISRAGEVLVTHS